MDIQNRPAIRQAATESLAAAPGNPQKTALIYAAGSALVSLAVTLIVYLLDLKIEGTGGLGNIGLRAVLETVNYILPLALNIGLMCVGFGYRIATMRMARRENSSPAVLLEGFRHFGPLIRLLILQALIFLAIGFVTAYIAVQIFLVTPLASDFLEILEPILSSTSILNSGIGLDDATLSAATGAMLPLLPIFLVLFLIAGTPVYYQYRMAQFALADDPRRGALAAMRESRTMMRHNRRNLFKLDLGFWWFYLAEILISVVCYGDVLLPMVGINLPLSDTANSFLFYIFSLAIQVGLYALCLNRIHVTYATAYEALRPKRQQTNTVALGNIFEM